jgi:hypothetical protein
MSVLYGPVLRDFARVEAGRVCGIRAAILLTFLPECRRFAHAIVRQQRMLHTTPKSRLARGPIAACLAILLSFASLTPLAAAAFDGLSPSCCRNHAKSCCRKAHTKTPAGPAISGNSCNSDCAQWALNDIRQNPLVRPSTPSGSGSGQVFGRVSVAQFSPATLLSDNALQQRPPPAASLA